MSNNYEPMPRLLFRHSISETEIRYYDTDGDLLLLTLERVIRLAPNIRLFLFASTDGDLVSRAISLSSSIVCVCFKDNQIAIVNFYINDNLDVNFDDCEWYDTESVIFRIGVSGKHCITCDPVLEFLNDLTHESKLNTTLPGTNL